MSNAHILVVDDEADIRTLLKEILSEEGYEVDVAANAAQARASRAKQTPDLVLLDIWMPDVDGITLLREWSATTTNGCPVVMMSGHGTVETAVEATRLGAFDFVEKPLSLAKLLRTVERALDAGKRKRQTGKLMVPPLMVPVGKSKLMQQVRTELQQISGNPSSVLLVGESGTGREAFARYLHEHSPRSSQPFVAVVASSLRDADGETQLFGTEHDGGSRRVGLLEEAGNGTLFINQIEDLPPNVQRALAGAFESGRFTRVGGSEPIELSARIVSSAQPGIEGRVGTEGFSSRPARAPEHAHRPRAAVTRIRGGRARTAPALRGPCRGYRRHALPAIQRRGSEPPAELPMAGQRPRAEDPRASLADPGRAGRDPAGRNRAGAGRSGTAG